MRRHIATARDPYIQDNNIPLPEVSQPFESVDFNWGTDYELILK